jgi:hypothetical protein
MKLYNYHQFTQLQEANDTSDIVHNPLTLHKRFFAELKTHVEYWFANGGIQKMATILSIDAEPDSLVVWLEETGEVAGKAYRWRVNFYPIDRLSPLTVVEEVTMALTLFDASENALKTTTLNVKVEDLKESFLRKKMRRVRTRVLQAPKDKKEVKKFARGGTRYLQDDIY